MAFLACLTWRRSHVQTFCFVPRSQLKKHRKSRREEDRWPCWVRSPNLYCFFAFWPSESNFYLQSFTPRSYNHPKETQRNFGSCSQLIVYEIFDLEQHLESSPKRRLYHLFVNSIICSEGEPLPSCHPSSENEQNKPPWPFSADHLHRIRSQTTQTTFQESIFSLVTNSILRSRRRVLALLITLDNEGRLYGSTWPLRNQRRNQSSDHGKLQSSIDVSG